MGFRIFRQIDSAHPSFAEQRKDLVMGHRGTWLKFQAINQHLSGRLKGRRIDKVTCFFVRPEQFVDLSPQ
jgi:hypothetical protein